MKKCMNIFLMKKNKKPFGSLIMVQDAGVLQSFYELEAYQLMFNMFDSKHSFWIDNVLRKYLHR